MNFVINNWPYQKYFKNKLPETPLSLDNQLIVINDNNIDEPIDVSKNYDLHGFFQNYRYFDDVSVKYYFEPESFIIEDILREWPVFLNEKTCSIHIRRSDYLKIFPNDVLPLSYYKNALDFLYPDNNDITIFIFSDDQNVADFIGPVLKRFKNVNYILSKNNNINFTKEGLIEPSEYNDIHDFFMMSMCSDNIISNSTFSWFSAYLNKNADKRVILPHRWISNIDINNFARPEWFVINCENVIENFTKNNVSVNIIFIVLIVLMILFLIIL